VGTNGSGTVSKWDCKRKGERERENHSARALEVGARLTQTFALSLSYKNGKSLKIFQQ
jgi:hypothetical protein